MKRLLMRILLVAGMATSLLTLSAVSIDDWDSTDWATKVTQFNSTPVANVSGVNGVTATAAPPPIALVANTIKEALGATVTTDAIVTTGSTLLIISVSSQTTIGVISDSKGNTWHNLTIYGDASKGMVVISYAYDHGGSALSVGTGHTFSVAVGFGTPVIAVTAWSGTDITSAVYETSSDVGCSTGGTTSTTLLVPASGNITPATTGDLVIAAYSSLSGMTTLSVNNGFTITDWLHTGSGYTTAAQAYLVTLNTNALTTTWTSSSSVHMSGCMAIFAKAP